MPDDFSFWNLMRSGRLDHDSSSMRINLFERSRYRTLCALSLDHPERQDLGLRGKQDATP